MANPSKGAYWDALDQAEAERAAEFKGVLPYMTPDSGHGQDWGSGPAPSDKEKAMWSSSGTEINGLQMSNQPTTTLGAGIPLDHLHTIGDGTGSAPSTGGKSPTPALQRQLDAMNAASPADLAAGRY